MKYFLGFLASIGLVVLVFILVLRGFSGDRGPAPEDRVSLVNYANTNVIVRLTTDGPITADQNHHAYEITVGRSEARMEVFQGYEQHVIRSKSYQNNDDAYANFLRAIDLAGFTNGRADPDRNDPRGVCATGDRYILEIISGAAEIQRFWTTSCGNLGTFRGKIGPINQLFVRQIPDYSTLITNTNL